MTSPTSVTIAENCAESPMTVTPHTTDTSRKIQRGASNVKPMSSAQRPDNAIMIEVVAVRPMRSAITPPRMQPMMPEPITANVIRDALDVLRPRSCSAAWANARNQPHIAYSSHMWPK